MLSSRRSLLRAGAALAAVAALPACGFQPLYGTHGATAGVSEKLGQVDIAHIPERRGQQLRNLLIDRFYENQRPGSPLYRLDVTIQATEQKLALRKDASTDRAQLVIVAPFRLIDPRSGAVLMSAASRSLVAYNIIEEQYNALVNRDDAYERGLSQISEDITARVAMFLGRSA